MQSRLCCRVRGWRCCGDVGGKLRMGMRPRMEGDGRSAVRCGIGLQTQRQMQIQRRGLLTKSYCEGPSEPPLLQNTIPQHFRSIVAAHGDNLAVISRAQNAKLTYRELDERSNALAKGLQEKGVGKGDRVAVSLGNGWEFAVGTYGIWKVGGVLVPLNPAFNTKQVVSAMNHLEAEHLIIGTETHLPFKQARENISLLRDIVGDLDRKKIESDTIPSLKNVFLVNNQEFKPDEDIGFASTTPFNNLIDDYTTYRNREVIPNSPLHKDEVINIQFTSGTTSTPKAACLTHHSILNNGHSIGSRMQLTPSDIVCCPPPLFHCFGSILGYMATATHGSTILFPSPSFSPSATLLSIAEHRATALYGVATMFIAELDLLSSGTIPKQGFSQLRTGIAAGSSVPKALMAKLHSELNLTGLTICYGMTETSPVSCMTTPDDPLPKRLSTVGRLLPHVAAKIVSVSEPRRILPVGEKGELAVEGYLVMKGYYADEVRTKEVLRPDEEGRVWMFTGDEACMDEEGYVSITGRIKDLIIRGGENIHPLEVEDCIYGVGEVREVAVVGVRDERYGEVVAAFVVVKKGVRVRRDDKIFEDGGERGEVGKTEDIDEDGEGNGSEKEGVKMLTKEKIQEHVRKHLSNHLVPKYVFWVEEYPKTASGKIQKFKLREMGERWLGL